MSANTQPEKRFIERRGSQLAVAMLGSVLSLGLLALLLLPSLASAVKVEVAQGSEAYAIGAATEIEPARGWSVQPAAERGSLLPGEGLVLRSPDRMLTVLLRPALPGERLVSGDESNEDATVGKEVVGRVLTETLDNGATLSHGISSADAHLVALLRPPGVDEAAAADAGSAEAGSADAAAQRVFIEAQTEDPALLDNYRAELALLLLNVRAVR